MHFVRILLIIVPFISLSQERCGITNEFFQNRSESTKQFETWLQKKSLEPRPQISEQFRVADAVYKIPVVFHILHNGEPLGVGTNISEQRIIEQIKILNEDFRRTNPDRTQTPEEFQPFAADVEIEFVLAKRDPEGLPTKGITRKMGSYESYSFQQREHLSKENYWPAEQYMNIYVADLKTPYIGWSSFPFTDLNGIDELNNDKFTDAVSIDYKYVGINSNTSGTYESFGRSATHEIGHFLGLRHIWGDSNSCETDDFCSDTPAQSGDYLGQCPDKSSESCGSNDMYSNYLNYTADACMNIFTKCQKSRMRTVIENSPRRKSLLTSPALNSAIVTTNDMGIKSILSPSQTECTNTYIPAIELRNYGTNSVQGFEVSIYSNSQMIETISKVQRINPLELVVVNFSEIEVSNATSKFEFVIKSVNNGVDNNPENDKKEIEVTLAELGNLPYLLDFETPHNALLRTETNNNSSWMTANAPYKLSTNLSAVLDFKNTADTYGLFDYLITPIIDLSSVNSVELSFLYAYQATTNRYDKDGLIVAVSTDCGESFIQKNYLFEKYGQALGTKSQSNNDFVPAGPNEWREVKINLTNYAGQGEIRVAFIGHNGGAGTLYLDNIQITPTELRAYDLGIKTVSSLPIVTCSGNINPDLEVRNYGYETITSFDYNYNIGTGMTSSSQQNISIESGGLDNFSIPITNLEDGSYSITLTVANPNNQVDEYNENNSYTHYFVVDNTKEELPIKQDFDELNNWIITNSTNNPLWEMSSSDENNFLTLNAFEETTIGTKHWLVSPLLNTQFLDSLSLVFEYAYKYRAGFSDRFQVILSANCGRTFNHVLFDKSSKELSAESWPDSYHPTLDEDWKEVFIDLNEYIIWDEIRIAFVFTNGNGNNFFLDNIAFVNTANPEFPRTSKEEKAKVYPNPVDDYLNIAFNLDEKEDLTIQLNDLAGKVIMNNVYSEILNHIIRLPLSTYSGVFILTIRGKTINLNKKVVLKN